jgi:prepilin-type N-terminal cleavage/methylation domain-containing protein
MGAMKRQDGFTLVELMVAMALGAILMTLGALALRNYWWHRALEGGADEIVTQVRELQERVVAETHPLVYGARFGAGDEEWSLVRYDPEAGTCSQYSTLTLDAGVEINTVNFASDPVVTGFCAGALGAGSDEFVFFYARGNATAGSVTISHAGLGRSETVSIAGVTGRADRT